MINFVIRAPTYNDFDPTKIELHSSYTPLQMLAQGHMRQLCFSVSVIVCHLLRQNPMLLHCNPLLYLMLDSWFMSFAVCSGQPPRLHPIQSSSSVSRAWNGS